MIPSNVSPSDVIYILDGDVGLICTDNHAYACINAFRSSDIANTPDATSRRFGVAPRSKYIREQWLADNYRNIDFCKIRDGAHLERLFSARHTFPTTT